MNNNTHFYNVKMIVYVTVAETLIGIKFHITYKNNICIMYDIFMDIQEMLIS